MRILGLSLYGSLAASTRYRLQQYSSHLQEQNLTLDIHPLLSNHYLSMRFEGKPIPWRDVFFSFVSRLRLLHQQKTYDCAIVYGELLPFIPHLIESKILTLPYLYDFDDAFYLKYKEGSKLIDRLLGRKFDQVLEKASAVTAGNRVLYEYAERHNENVHLLPTVVDTQRYRVIAKQPSENFTIGWIGSPTTAPYLETVKDALEQLSKEFQVRLIVVGGKAPKINGLDVQSFPWDQKTEIEHINSFDVGIMPLSDDDWSRGKCAFKLIQYMACGVPAVGSAIGANTDVVNEECGFLANTSEQWLQSLRLLAQDPELRSRMGNNARKRIIDYYSLDVHKHTLAQAIHSMAVK